MKLLRRLRPYVLLAAVLIGQWLAFVHFGSHSEGAASNPAHACSFCATNLGSAPPPSAPRVALELPAQHPVLHSRMLAPVARSDAPLNIRGPPSIPG